MARGHPDFGQDAQTAIIGTIADLGELAARLGSVSIYHRLGNVMFQDGFENGLSAWIAGFEGAGGSVAIDSNISYSGAKSVVLTAGSDGNHNATLLKRIQPIALTKLGIEMTFSFETVTDRIYFGLQYNSGAMRYQYNIRFEEDNDLILYRDNLGNYQTLTTFVFTSSDAYMFHTAKLVIDLEALEYVYLFCDNEAFSLTGIAGQDAADATQPRIEINIGNTGRLGSNDIARIDNVVLTVNEP